MAQTQQASDALLPGSLSTTGDSSLPMSRERSWWEWLARGLACLVLTLGAVPGARDPISQHLASVPGFQWVVLACLVAIALPAGVQRLEPGSRQPVAVGLLPALRPLALRHGEYKHSIRAGMQPVDGGC